MNRVEGLFARRTVMKKTEPHLCCCYFSTMSSDGDPTCEVVFK